jgi:hypothetical protein
MNPQSVLKGRFVDYLNCSLLPLKNLSFSLFSHPVIRIIEVEYSGKIALRTFQQNIQTSKNLGSALFDYLGRKTLREARKGAKGNDIFPWPLSPFFYARRVTSSATFG